MSMLHVAGLSNSFWQYVISATVHIYNRSPSCTLQWWTPHEIWTGGHVPDVSYFRIFGCKGYMHIPADKRCKLDAKATEVTLIGYESGSKGYRLWDNHTRSVHLSWDVTFDESSFPSLSGNGPHPAQPSIFIPAIAIPNQIVEPQERTPSPAQSESSEEAVRDLLDRQSVRPNTPPPHITPLLITPEQCQPVPTSSLPCQVLRISLIDLSHRIRNCRGDLMIAYSKRNCYARWIMYLGDQRGCLYPIPDTSIRITR